MKQIILLLLYLSLPFSIIADQAIESFVTDTSSGIAYYQTFNNNEYGIGISGSFYSLDSSTNSNITNLGLWIEKRVQIQTDVIFNYGITLGTSFGTSSGSNIS